MSERAGSDERVQAADRPRERERRTGQHHRDRRALRRRRPARARRDATKSGHRVYPLTDTGQHTPAMSLDRVTDPDAITQPMEVPVASARERAAGIDVGATRLGRIARSFAGTPQRRSAHRRRPRRVARARRGLFRGEGSARRSGHDDHRRCSGVDASLTREPAQPTTPPLRHHDAD